MVQEAGAQEKTIPFLVNWVRQFFARYPGRKRSELGRREIEAFLADMTQHGIISNWQVAQARNALDLYYEQFRGVALHPRPDDLAQLSPPPSSVVVTKSYHDFDSKVKDIALPFRQASHQAQARDSSVPTMKTETTHTPPSTPFPRPAPCIIAKSEPSPLTPQGHPSPAVSTERGTGPQSGKTNWNLLEARTRECLQVAHYSRRTEQTYVGWIKRFVIFHQGRKPSTMDAGHVRDFLRHLAMDKQVASSTQNQAA